MQHPAPASHLGAAPRPRPTPACHPAPPAPQLAGRLSEEYLALLPETLPFLSELLEDAELAVEARAARLVRQLEALSGESLAQYLS